MKSFIISLLTLLLLDINLLYSQTWPKYYGIQNRREYVKGIIEHYDSGYLILGEFFNATYTKRWAWLIKTDINGNTLWEKIFENSLEWVNLRAIEQTTDGGWVICGSAMVSSDIFIPLVLKLNACGEKEWCKLFEGSPNNQSAAIDIKETGNGDIVVLVMLYGSIPEETIHLFKLNADGEVLWIEAFATMYDYPNTQIKEPERLFITNEGKYIISGHGYWEQPWNPGGPMPLTPLFIMVDSDGNEEWVLPYGLNDTIIGRAFSVSKESDSTILGMAHHWGANLIPLFAEFNHSGQETNYRLLHPQNIDSNLVSGTLIRMYSIDSMNYAQGSFRYAPDQSIPIAVVELEDDLFGMDTIVTNYDIIHGHVAHRFNKTFDNKLLSSGTFTQSSVNYDISLAKLNLNLEYDTAYTGNFTYDSLCIPGPPQSGFIYLNDCDIVLGTEMPTAREYRARKQTILLNIYPNPAKDQITFAMENTQHHRNIELRCFNLLGVLQHQTTIIRGQTQATLDVSPWPPGMYVAVVYSDEKPVARGKFVVSR